MKLEMEYHYSELPVSAVSAEHADSYSDEYAAPFIMSTTEAEYHVRSTVLVDGGDRFGVSAVVFDKYEELVWMGNQGGHVTSYYGPSMQKYTSFQIHESEEVRDIITVEQGIYALTKTSLRHQIRRGIPKHTFRSANMTDMQCLYHASTNKLLMGGHQSQLVEIDLIKMKDVAIPIAEEGCAVLRSGGGSLVTCGSVGGVVTLRDVRCPGVAEQTFRAHSACLSDLDMQGNLLITCGFTNGPGGEAVAEPCVKVWDVRRLRGAGGVGAGPAWSARGLPSPPLLLHFLPAVSGRAVAVAGDGRAALLHLGGQDAEGSHFQVNTQSSVCTVMDVSSTSQALVFGDQSGHLNLFSPQHNTDPVYNNFSRATEFADPVVGVPYVSFTDTNFRYSSVSLPPLAASSSNKWFNELPQQFYKRAYRRPKPIDPEVLKTMKMQGPIGYAPNPRTVKRNQMPYVEETFDDLNTSKQTDTKTNLQPIPKQYLKVDSRFTKQSDVPNDTEVLNRTGYPGLEATLPNSYCNPMLQVLYYMPPVKATLLSHSCAKEFCLTCELGFLFRTLDSCEGAACEASAFLRAFRTVPEAAALGLILPERPLPDAAVDFATLIQSWNRFILHQMHYEILETRKKEKELAILAQNVNNTPNGGSRLGNLPLNTSKINARLQPTSGLNGIFNEKFIFTELEYLSPTTEFELPETDFNREQAPLAPDEGAHDTDQGPVPNATVGLVNGHNVDTEESDISQLFAIGRHQLNRCLKCNKEEERESAALACALQYPPAAGAEGTEGAQGARRGGFLELLRASLASRRNTPAWCEQCRRFSPTLQRGRIVRLPPILAINCGGVTAHEKSYWTKGVQKEMVESSKRAGSSKPCRYGLHCVRPGCRFKHPDRPGPAPPSVVSKSPSHDAQCVLPHTLLIRLQPDGEIAINDKMDQTNDTSSQDDSEEEYSLTAAVVCVEDHPKNLVAFIQISAESGPQWYLFNDLSIEPVVATEVVQYSAWWKCPCVLFYCARRPRM